MHLPSAIQAFLENQSASAPKKALRAASERLSARYRAIASNCAVSLNDEQEVLAYAAARMPATYAACAKVFALVRDVCPNLHVASHCDMGCGTGTALFAAETAFAPLTQTGIDRHPLMLDLARRLAQANHCAMTFRQAEIGDSTPECDLVTACYAIGEMAETEWPRIATTLWRSAAKMVIIVEPGSPRGHATILALRQAFIALGGQIVAPCPHQLACPIRESWCHNGVRLGRSRLHKLLKNADSPFEDEQFCYLAISKTDCAQEQPMGRILHTPIDNKTGLTFTCCRADGTLTDVFVPRRDKEAHRAARRLGRGDALFALQHHALKD